MPTMRPLYGGCPLLGGSVMGGSTVLWQKYDKNRFLTHRFCAKILKDMTYYLFTMVS